jgi:hypothetical protein
MSRLHHGLEAAESNCLVGAGADAGNGLPIASAIAAISSCWVTMISWASRLIRGLLPWRSTAIAISIAPWW